MGCDIARALVNGVVGPRLQQSGSSGVVERLEGEGGGEDVDEDDGEDDGEDDSKTTTAESRSKEQPPTIYKKARRPQQEWNWEPEYRSPPLLFTSLDRSPSCTPLHRAAVADSRERKTCLPAPVGVWARPFLRNPSRAESCYCLSRNGVPGLRAGEQERTSAGFKTNTTTTTIIIVIIIIAAAAAILDPLTILHIRDSASARAWTHTKSGHAAGRG
ncbi:hypothetical protein DRE_06534 [Drechslerella stenobrocha 248]|uniref:Uncharacterized protein n=1 Tax=Drechslerella stenobrocha 248 TaxID=1043628 RepID=W7HL91_9PEZI|nr:hypothetical protein DRE_06534 [Drechslerella stenobrocha 248]